MSQEIKETLIVFIIVLLIIVLLIKLVGGTWLEGIIVGSILAFFFGMVIYLIFNNMG